MDKVGNDKTHLDIEENRLYLMTFMMFYEGLFIPIDTYVHVYTVIPCHYYRGKSVFSKRNIFDVWRLC